MREITAADAERDFGALLKRVEDGETILVSREGRPVARITPEVATRRDPEALKRAMADLEEIRKRSKPISIEEIIAWRDEGRK